MITADRFIATSDNRAAWLAARLPGVTATEVAKAATPSGFAEAVNERRNPVDVTDNDYMRFGRENEEWIALWVKDATGIMPNHWLIAAEDNRLFLSTPDGLSLDHTTIAEIKTGGRAPTKPPIQHLRQIHWQFRTTGAQRCLYAFMPRIEVNGRFMPGRMEPLTWWVERDESMIQDLEQTALRLLESDERQAA